MKIVVLDGYTLNPGDLSWEGIAAFGNLEVHERTASDRVYERIADADIVFTNKVPVGGDIIHKLSQLKFIGVLATGYNIIDTEAAKQKGITVSNVPGYSTMSVMQLCFALILELAHHTWQHHEAVKSGKWTNSADFCFWDFPLIELAGKTIGILGFGNIGRQVADTATAFGMNIIAFSRTQTDQHHRKNFRWVTLGELFSQSDIISIHCPLTPETEGLINSDNLQKMKRTAFIINTSRGPIVNENDLAFALNNDIIAGAGLDVLSTEPPAADNPLLTAKNCIITPHIAWATREARMRMMEISTRNLQAFLNGNPENVVNH